MSVVQQRLPLPLPLASGLDAVVRYALGFVTPTPANLDTAHTFVRFAYGESMAREMANTYAAIWPGWALQGRVHTPSRSTTEWRLTEAGVAVVEDLLSDPGSSWRRGLSRATILTLGRLGAAPTRSARRIQMMTGGDSEPTRQRDPTRSSWISAEALEDEVRSLLEAVERGDPLRNAFRGVRAPVCDPAIGRVLWRLEKEGLVTSRKIQSIGTQSDFLVQAASMATIRRVLGSPPLSMLSERLIATRRRTAGSPPQRMQSTSLYIQQIAQALMFHPTDPVAAMSREHVVRLGSIARRLDIAVWTPEDLVAHPSIWIEATDTRLKSGSSLARIEHHVMSAAAASAVWRQPISLYIVGPTQRAHLMTIAAVLDRVATSKMRLGTDLTVSVLSSTAATEAPVWRARPLRTERYGVARRKATSHRPLIISAS